MMRHRRPHRVVESTNHLLGEVTNQQFVQRKLVADWRNTSHVILIAVAALLCYSQSLHGDFVFDDNEAVVNNKDVTKEDVQPWSLFEHDFWGSNITSKTSHKSYRPLTVLTFRWNHQLAGGLHPWGFHVVNVVLHTNVCIILYIVLLVIFAELEHTSLSAFICTLLFAVHPVHTECVAGIVGRAELLCALFCLLSLYLYMQSCYSGYSAGAAVYLVVSCALCAVSVLCKEQGITVLGLCSAYDIILFNQLHPIKFVFKLRNISQTTSGRKLLLRHSALMITGVLTLTLRWKVMGSQAPVFHEVDNPHSFVNNTALRVLNYNYLYALNAWLCVCPYWLCFDWSMGCVPVVTSFVDTRLLAAIVLWIFLVTLICWSLTEPCNTHKRLVQMSLALLVIPYLPASNLLLRVGFVVAERVLYMPSLGVCMLVTIATSHHRHSKVLTVFLALLVCLFIARSVQRSRDWRTEMELFESAEAVCPQNAKVQYNIAKVHADAGNVDYALQKYRLALELNPTYDQAMNNLGNLLKERGEHIEAEQLLLNAVSIRRDFAAAWMNLGIVQATLGKHATAEASYLSALTHRRRYPDCYYNLGNLYLDMKRHSDALTAWRNATLQNPTHSSAWLNMVILLDNLERYDELSLVAEEALRWNPREAAIHYNVASALGKAARYQASEQHFRMAVQLSPTTASYHANLGVLYHRWGKYKEADAAYTRALELNPSDSQTQGYRNSVRKKLQSDAG